MFLQVFGFFFMHFNIDVVNILILINGVYFQNQMIPNPWKMT